MKKVLTICFIIFSIVFTLFSCKKSTTSSGSDNPTDNKYYGSFTIFSKQYGYGSGNYQTTPQELAQNKNNLYSFAGSVQNIQCSWTNGISSTAPYSINITTNNALSVKSYNNVNANSSYVYNALVNGGILLLTVALPDGKIYYPKNATLTITKIDNVGGLIQGNFSGTFQNGDDLVLQTNANISSVNCSFSIYRQY